VRAPYSEIGGRRGARRRGIRERGVTPPVASMPEGSNPREASRFLDGTDSSWRLLLG
jgi:hypothetical protein